MSTNEIRLWLSIDWDTRTFSMIPNWDGEDSPELSHILQEIRCIIDDQLGKTPEDGEAIEPGTLVWSDYGYAHRVTRVTAKKVFIERATRDERACGGQTAYGEWVFDRAKLEANGWVRARLSGVSGDSYTGHLSLEDSSHIADHNHRVRVQDPAGPGAAGQHYQLGGGG